MSFNKGEVIKLDWIGKGEDRNQIILGPKIAQGTGQACFFDGVETSARVVKILYGPKWKSTKALLGLYDIERIPEFHFQVLQATQNAGVRFPKYWNVISGILNGERIDGFLQSYIKPGISDMFVGKLPNIGQDDTGFLENTHQDYRGIGTRGNDAEFAFDGTFLDWDGYLRNIFSGKRREESLSDFYKRIAETKLD